MMGGGWAFEKEGCLERKGGDEPAREDLGRQCERGDE